MIVCILGYQKSFIAFLEFLPFNLFICKRLHNTDSSKGVLQRSIDITNLPAVIKEGSLHLTVLLCTEEDHQ